MTMHGSIEIATQRLTLAPFTRTDIDAAYLTWLNDPAVTRFSNQRFRRHDESSSQLYLKSFEGTPNAFLAIRLRDGGRMIGTMTAYVSEPHRTADMGLMIGDRAFWGQGFGFEAWSHLMAFLFAGRRLRKVTGGTVRSNIGMQKIMERAGMRLEAVRERQELIDGREEDILYFARFTNI